ncbi:MAG: hypothetical protein OES64_05660 [Desulfobacteraceae bacterium]|nr:hypothetical protein [Desulfobacteraceae bacterium]MDH3838174.1 hypothetical protein [Desulfobacteraceae bacterium]MDH3881019.1 hypothetical protein [Desulfobacteraceae bacterium]
MKINKMTLYAPEGAVVMDNSFLIVWVVLAGCWYSSQHPIDSVSSWEK